MKVKNNRKKVFKEYMTDSETPSTTSEPQPGDPVTSKEWKSIGYLVLVCVILIVLSFVAAFFTRKEKGDGINDFLGFTGKSATIGGILVGLVSSTIFGMIDNGGLYFGMSSLDPIFRSKKLDNLESAGWGNTFSDFLGAFVGTFIGKFVQNISGVQDTALWAEVIGIIIGCILGIYIPKLIKNSKLYISLKTK